MAETRIYVVEETKNPAASTRLIEATSASQAIRHCTRKQFSVKAAGPKDIATLMTGGVQIERAIEAADAATN